MLTKETQKIFLKNLKMEGKKYNYKFKSGDLYKRNNEAFIFTHTFFWPKRLDYNLEIIFRLKKYMYDDILWEILGFEDNAKCAESLRKEGAFVSPSIVIQSKYYLIDDGNIQEEAKKITEEVNYIFNDFLKNNSIAEYIMCMDEKKVYNGSTLKTIAYIDCGMLEEAKKYVDQAIEEGESGGFIIGDESFFELARKYLEKRLL